MFGAGLGGFVGLAIATTLRISSFAVPQSTLTMSPTTKLFRLPTRSCVAPADDAMDRLVPNRSAPVSKLYAITPRLYQCSSALLPAAE